MKIQWMGHSCFLITNEMGHALLTDPFDDSLGYPVPRVRLTWNPWDRLDG